MMVAVMVEVTMAGVATAGVVTAAEVVALQVQLKLARVPDGRRVDRIEHSPS